MADLAAVFYGPVCACAEVLPEPRAPSLPSPEPAPSEPSASLALRLAVLSPCEQPVVPTSCLYSREFVAVVTIRNLDSVRIVLSPRQLPLVELVPLSADPEGTARCLSWGSYLRSYEGGVMIDEGLILGPGEEATALVLVAFSDLQPNCTERLAGWVRLRAVVESLGERPGDHEEPSSDDGPGSSPAARRAPCQLERYAWTGAPGQHISGLPPTPGWGLAFGRADPRSTERDVELPRLRGGVGCCGDAYLLELRARHGDADAPYCLPESSLQHLLGTSCLWPCDGPETIRSNEVDVWFAP